MADKLLTHKECEQILGAQSVKGLQVRGYEIIPATEAHGFLGDYYRLVLHCSESSPKYDAEAKRQTKFIFFVKSLPLKSAEASMSEIFLKEAKLYATLLKDLQTYSTIQWCPKSFYARSDLLVLEDLTNIGYEKCRHQENSLSDGELIAILGALAGLHASSIVLEKRDGISIENHYSAVIFKEICFVRDIAYFKTGVNTLLDLAKVHPLYQSKKMQNFIANELEDILCSTCELVNPSKVYQNVLCHRDSWHSNVLFNYTGPNVSAILVDFQTCRYCPPCIDLLLAIFLNQKIELRAATERDYLMSYYEQLKSELSRHGVDADACLPFEVLLSSYEDLKLFGFVYRAMAATLIAVPPDLITNDYKYITRTEPLLRIMSSNEALRLYLEKCIAEMLDYVTQKLMTLG